MSSVKHGPILGRFGSIFLEILLLDVAHAVLMKINRRKHVALMKYAFDFAVFMCLIFDYYHLFKKLFFAYTKGIEK